MGWGGAGGGTGNASAGIGTFYFLAAILLYAGGIGEWILGNTFPAVVFFTFGGFWGAFGATLTPSFNAINGYGTTAEGTAAFYRSFAVFLIWMVSAPHMLQRGEARLTGCSAFSASSTRSQLFARIFAWS